MEVVFDRKTGKVDFMKVYNSGHSMKYSNYMTCQILILMSLVKIIYYFSLFNTCIQLYRNTNVGVCQTVYTSRLKERP